MTFARFDMEWLTALTPVVIVESDGSTEVSEQGATSDSYDITLKHAPSHPVTVTATPKTGDIDLGAGPGAAVARTFSPGDWSAQTITVTAVDDAELEGDETFDIVHTVTSDDPAFRTDKVPDVSTYYHDVLVRDNELGSEESQPLSQEASELYYAAFTAYVGGDLARGVEKFQKFIERYPDAPVVHAAQFWIAESYFGMNDYDSASRRYDMLIKEYPNSDKVPAAYFGNAEACLKLGRQMQAVSDLKGIVNRFPESDVVQKAAELLRALGE